MNPPVEAPTSSAVPARDLELERLERVVELLAPARDEPRRLGHRQLRRLVDLLARLLVAGHLPGQHQRLRLRAALGEPALDEQDVQPFFQEVRTASSSTMPSSTLVSASISASAARARSADSSASCRRPLGAVLEHVAVLVQDVVDDLEEQPELVAERAPGRLLPLRHLRGPEAEPDRGGEQAARLQPVQRGEVGRGSGDVEVLAADHPERRLRELAADRRASGTTAPAGTPPPAARRPRGCRPPRRSASRSRDARGAPRRRRAPAGRRGRARRCGRARARPPQGAPSRRLHQPPRQSRGRSPAARACPRPRSSTAPIRPARRAPGSARGRRGTTRPSARSSSRGVTILRLAWPAAAAPRPASRSRESSERISIASSGSFVSSSFARVRSSRSSSSSALFNRSSADSLTQPP